VANSVRLFGCSAWSLLVENRVNVTKTSLDRSRCVCFAVGEGNPTQTPIDVKMLSGWNLIDDFGRRLALVQARPGAQAA
jgi:hypothetical protein